MDNIGTKNRQRTPASSFFVIPWSLHIPRSAYVAVFLFVFSLLLFPLVSVRAQSLTPQQKAKLEQELAQVEAEQKQAEAALSSAQAQSSSLQRDIAVLDAKIKVAQLNIRAKNLLIESLGKDIKNKESHIETLDDRIEQGRNTLAVIMRKTNEVGSYSLPEVLLSQSTVSGALKDLDTFASVQEGLRSTFEQIRSDKSETQAEKDALEKRRNAETDARYAIQQEQKNIQADEKEKQGLLAISKGNEAAYKTLVAQKAAQAAQIRATLFPLAGAEPIPFGTAYQYAKEAEERTGIRPAFLLAIFAQESSLSADATFGRYVGSCYLSDTKTGAGININSKKSVANVMKPERDVQPFLDITKALGFDPYTTRVSCPLATGGYGGAMGAAQFIPDTWIRFKDRLAKVLGISGMPNPWNPEHAFIAASMLLTDNGAAARTYTAERTAALKYYAGGYWNLPKNAFYGNQVMLKAAEIQMNMINPLQGL